VYEFSVWHRLSVDDPLDPFAVEVERIASGAVGPGEGGAA
jgi:hypothetical protein